MVRSAPAEATHSPSGLYHRRPHFPPRGRSLGRLDGRSGSGVPLTHRTIARGSHDAGPVPAERRAEDPAVARMAQRGHSSAARSPHPTGRAVPSSDSRSQSRAIGAEAHQRPDLGAEWASVIRACSLPERSYTLTEKWPGLPADNRQSFPVGTPNSDNDRSSGPAGTCTSTRTVPVGSRNRAIVPLTRSTVSSPSGALAATRTILFSYGKGTVRSTWPCSSRSAARSDRRRWAHAAHSGRGKGRSTKTIWG